MIKLIVGLGNVGAEYKDTRHNAGFWFVDELTDKFNITLTHDKKFHGDVGRGTVFGSDVRFIKPSTLMNRSGMAVAPFAKFYGIQPHEILIAHDELDISAGNLRLKKGGGHGGHNGLKDIVPHTTADFWRLRVGIGRPTHSSMVSSWVLSKPTQDDRTNIDKAIVCGIEALELLMTNQEQKAISLANGFKL
ncbi:aminoacyl-tRNA hydrolase [Moraxella oblonga]|uniref:aminoacyl-tRNA hydrolase n=1 Tax=Moraxella oblonga TaxID=200413 RepID=UPI0008304C8E|nr:aminoacyl-tRNA hydrolase [Moraxella oblonga]